MLLRHGYRRVTIDDVAAGAGIGKGTVYLHWKAREQLFGAVFAREVLHAVDELCQALRQDPRTCLLHRFAHTYFLAIVNRPLLRSFLLGDPELLGKLTASPDTARDDRHSSVMRGYFALLAEHGLLRDDLSVDEVGYAYQATFEGFLRAEGASPVDGPEQRADLLARTVRRAFESESQASDAAVADLAAATIALLGDLIDADRAEFGIPEA
ncbi:helix-turn-helix domain-containing protein [Actinoallomurus vinaceus]|uniref:Helix-turn-helix domain-containing protein n=1 Tax=Actinoallomurus vinaceus TaxID=1080074 RepID=A0ABP8U2M5_9ACTN